MARWTEWGYACALVARLNGDETREYRRYVRVHEASDNGGTYRQEAPNLPAGAGPGAGNLRFVARHSFLIPRRHRYPFYRRSAPGILENQAENHALPEAGKEVVDEDL